jgi:hypothetical protein
MHMDEENINNTRMAPPMPGEGQTAPKPKHKDALRARLAKKYPDRNFNDDEELAEQIGKDYDDTDKQLASYKDSEGKLSKMLASDPRSAIFLQAFAKGENPVSVLVEQFGDEFMDYLDDPEHQEEIAEAHKKYLERVANESRLEEEYKQNLNASLEAIDEAQKQNGWTDEYVNEGIKTLYDLLNDAIMGKIDPQTITLLNNGTNYDADMAQTGEEGYVRGRNAKIEEQLRKNRGGDGAPHLAGGGKTPIGAPKPKKPTSIFDVAAGVN